MKYVVDIAYTNKDTLEVISLDEKIFNCSIEAAIEKEKIIDSLPKNCFAHWNKIYPRIKCSCGEEVNCISFTNTCDCGKDYNFAGDLLADRSQWGYDTGEHWTDCY